MNVFIYHRNSFKNLCALYDNVDSNAVMIYVHLRHRPALNICVVSWPQNVFQAFETVQKPLSHRIL